MSTPLQPEPARRLSCLTKSYNFKIQAFNFRVTRDVPSGATAATARPGACPAMQDLCTIPTSAACKSPTPICSQSYDFRIACCFLYCKCNRQARRMSFMMPTGAARKNTTVIRKRLAHQMDEAWTEFQACTCCRGK
eukprot:1103287-Pelagomonas_calceolata.AAC.1